MLLCRYSISMGYVKYSLLKKQNIKSYIRRRLKAIFGL